MSAAIGRALTMIAVVLQSYFYWEEPTPYSRTILPKSEGNYHLAALLLARGGSKGIPKKNLADVNGQPLIGRALKAMVRSNAFTSIWVSTDDEEIYSWVRKHYPKNIVHIHKRAAYTATDSASSLSAALEFLSFHPEIDAIGLVQATSPFIQPEHLKKASNLLLYNNDPQYESVFSVTRSHQLRWVNEGPPKSAKYVVPINFSPKSRPRRQDWQGELIENGMFYFVFRQVLIEHQVFQSSKSGYIEIPKHLSLEIDSFEDLEIARSLAPIFDGKESSTSNHANDKLINTHTSNIKVDKPGVPKYKEL